MLGQGVEKRVKVVEDEKVKLVRFADPQEDVNRNIVNVDYFLVAKDKQHNEWVEINEIHRMRHYSIPEIQMLASFSGFKLIKAEEFLTGNIPSKSTWGVTFILQKK